MGKEPRFYTPAEAGRVLGLHPSTVRYYTDTGRLQAERTAGGLRLISATKLRAFLRRRRAERPKAAQPRFEPRVAQRAGL